MGERNAVFHTEGTSALKAVYTCDNAVGARIISFEEYRHALDGQRPERRINGAGNWLNRAREVLRGVLDASEMYCSLRFEDFKGCPYMLFDSRSIAILAAGSSVIAIVSLALGA